MAAATAATRSTGCNGAPPAIRRAIAELEGGDVLVIAGKGHESGQIVGDRVLPFSDHEAVAAAKAGLAQYITAHATSYSFEAVFRTLGLWVAAALLVAFLLKRPTVHKGMHGLH